MNIFEKVSKDIEIDPNLLKAIVKVETNGFNLLNNRLIIRWESHYFKKFTGINIYVHGKRGYITEECQDNEYEAFLRAKDILENGKYSEEAYKSISMGIGQIMGENYKRIGFDNPKDMYDFISKSEDNGIESIGMFIRQKEPLLKSCRNKDFQKIAYYYNGKYYYKYKYDEKIKKEYDLLCIKN